MGADGISTSRTWPEFQLSSLHNVIRSSYWRPSRLSITPEQHQSQLASATFCFACYFGANPGFSGLVTTPPPWFYWWKGLVLTPSGWFLLLFWEWIGFLFATCILVLVILRSSLIVNLSSFQLVTVDKKFERENCELPRDPSFPVRWKLLWTKLKLNQSLPL